MKKHIHSFKHALELAAELARLKLQHPAAHAKVQESWKEAFMVIALASLARALGPYFFPHTVGQFIVYRPDLFEVLGQGLLFAVQLSFSLLILGLLLQHLYKVKSLPLDQFFNLMGLGALVLCMALIPALNFVGLLWFAYILWRVLQDLAGLTTLERLSFLLLSGGLFWILGVF